MNLSSNLFPIELDFEEFQIQRILWQEGKLEELRVAHNQSYSFFRAGDYIYISPGEDELEALGEVVTIKINDDPGIVASLIRHIFFRSFKAKYPQLKLSFDPFTFPSIKDDHNLTLDFLPYNLRNSITYKKLNEIFIKRAEIGGTKKFLIVINSSYKWALREHCATLVNGGFNIVGLDVGKLSRYAASGDIVAASFNSIGKVISVQNETASIETNNGNVDILLNQLYLNKTYENIRLFLEYSVGAWSASEILAKVKQREYSRNDPSIIFGEIQQFASVLSKLEYRNFDGFYFRIAGIGTINFPALKLESPKYLFDVSFSKTDTSPSKGLNLFGPYDFGKFFEISHPKVLVICHKDSSGAFTQFLGRLKDGYSESPSFAKGFLAMYRLQDISYHFVEISDYSKETYITAIKKAINDFPHSFDVAIIETKEEFKVKNVIDDVYWVTKAYLLQRGITVQYLKETNARNPKFILDSFALQLYAKLGGTPWILPSSPNIAHELIVGIGSAFSKSNNYLGAQINRVVGITTFFNSDGRYLLSNKSKEVPYNDYFEELLKDLKNSIDTISLEQGWNDNDIVRIIFHVFKPMKNIEVDVVSELVSKYPKYDIKFAFVSFGEHHPYMMFDLDQQGIYSQYARTSKGKLVPYRGTNILIENGLCLLQLKGPGDIKTDKQGFIGPLSIRIHPKSSFTDATYLVQQVYRLTNISYRGFKPSQLPVSLLYASFITDQLNKLAQIPGWDSDFIKPLRNKKWFI